jgi:hypothetical protein
MSEIRVVFWDLPRISVGAVGNKTEFSGLLLWTKVALRCSTRFVLLR